MDRNDIILAIQAYSPVNEQEEKDKALTLSFLATYPDAFCRTNRLGHMTASAWVVNKDRTKVLMAYHNLYSSWAWLGGHADGEEDLLAVALKEVREEAGITKAKAVSDEILSLEVITVEGHRKKGQYVSSHLHFNLTYLIEADEEEEVKNKEDENSAVAWFTPEEALEKSSEPWFVERIYPKLIAKTKKM